MILRLLLFISFFDIFLSIHANQNFQFGIINHQTQWYFHCPQNNTKMLDPPSNDQPLISYECPYQSSVIEILPMEIDFTFLCRLQSRLIWIIIDLYQYNTFLWLINNTDIEIKIELNHKIELINFKNDVNNYTNRFIIINAFYIPFESIDMLLPEPIEINIQIKNTHQLNQCQFYIKDNYLWQTFIDNYCDSTQSKTLFVQYAKCDFYSNKFVLIDKRFAKIIFLLSRSKLNDTNPQIGVANDPLTTTTISNPSNLNIKPSPTINPISPSKENLTHFSITSSIPSHHHYFLLEENSRQILSTLTRSTKTSILLKLTFIFLIIILILLVLFFLYMLCYHYHVRLRLSSTTMKKSSLSI
jgi:hypothetical protein